jgi:drug/metabolite transporter (DMT)-like permease
MFWLVFVSLIWAFSFGLIKTELSALDSSLVSFIRLLISFIVFLPFLRIKNMDIRVRWKFIFTGMIQYGVMYPAYIYAYHFLKAYEIALFTILTPLYITLINDLLKRQFHKVYLIESLIAIFAAGIVVYNRITTKDLIIGFVLMQVSNAAFAFGQVYYKKVMKDCSCKDAQIFALLYGGAVLLSGLAASFTVDWKMVHINERQIYSLLYLGAVASGAGFFMWNYGARRTNTGNLAIINNLKIPLAVTVSFIFFGEEGNLLRLVIGGGILVLLTWYNERALKKR